jgi:diaminopimelate decarboxylase
VNHFQSKAGQLFAEGVSLARIAGQVGTPAYVYSAATLLRHHDVVAEAFDQRPTLLCFSVKSNSNLAVLRLLAQRGAGFDIVSGGELGRVLAAGGDPRKTVFSGVGKTEAEMAAALRAGILIFNVESAEELDALDRVGRRLKKRAAFSLRVNPDVDAKTHRHIATGKADTKFGVPFGEAVALYEKSRRLKGVYAKGVDCHIGSQLTTTAPVREAVGKVAGLYRGLLARGHALSHLDVGGGLGITYTVEKPPTVAAYARAVLEPLRGLPATLVLEPGRVLVGNAGVLLTRVLYRKLTRSGGFLIVDAGMNDLMRPALYDATHGIVAVKPRRGKKTVWDVVGPVCESTDTLGKKRAFGPLQPGDLLAVQSAGAYGMSMASNYNSRVRPAEVLVQGKTFRVVRARETPQDLWRLERR